MQEGCTALMSASFEGYTEIVELLTVAEAKVNIQNKVKLCNCSLIARIGSPPPCYNLFVP